MGLILPEFTAESTGIVLTDAYASFITTSQTSGMMGRPPWAGGGQPTPQTQTPENNGTVTLTRSADGQYTAGANLNVFGSQDLRNQRKQVVGMAYLRAPVALEAGENVFAALYAAAKAQYPGARDA